MRDRFTSKGRLPPAFPVPGRVLATIPAVRVDPVARLFFVGYCVVAGDFLCLAPWLPGWNRLVLAFPWPALQALLASAPARAAVTAFGVVHLVWSLHDVDEWARARDVAAAAHTDEPR